jgi:hypothetical protein
LFNASRDYRKKEECSCGMDLTEPVAQVEETAAEETTVVACSSIVPFIFS